MKRKQVYLAIIITLLLLTISVSLFACDDLQAATNTGNNTNGDGAQDGPPTNENFATTYSAFLNTSNVTFDIDLKETTVSTNLVTEPNETRTNGVNANYKCTICSNVFTRFEKDYTSMMLITFNPKNLYYKSVIAREWVDYSKETNGSQIIDNAFESNYWTALEEGETLTIQKSFATNPQFKDLLTSSDLSIKKIEGNIVFLNDIERQCTLEEAKAMANITEERIKQYNMTINQLDLTVSFKDIQITIEKGKVTKCNFTFGANGTTDVVINGQRQATRGQSSIETALAFRDYGTTTLPLDNPINPNTDAIAEETWNAQLGQYKLTNVLNYTGTGKAFYLSYTANNRTNYTRCLINSNNISYYSYIDSHSTNAYYTITSVTDTQFIYTELRGYNSEQDGELYKLPATKYSYYYPQEPQTEDIEDLKSDAFITIETVGDILDALKYDNFTYVTDHYEQIANVNVETSGVPSAELSNIKVYFNNGLLTKITCDFTVSENTIPYTLTFGYDFTMNLPTKVEADATV